MKVTLTRSLGIHHRHGDLREGETHDLAPEVAADLLDKKLAELADDEDELHAVSEENDADTLRAVPKGKRGRSKPMASAEPPSIDPLSDDISAAVGEVHD